MRAIFKIVYVLVFAVLALFAYAVFQIKLFGLKVVDFFGFIEAKKMLDKLYKLARQYKNMSPQEQILYLSEAEKIFIAFDKIPNELWEEEYGKYREVLAKYNDIRMLRWSS